MELVSTCIHHLLYSGFVHTRCIYWTIRGQYFIFSDNEYTLHTKNVLTSSPL